MKIKSWRLLAIFAALASTLAMSTPAPADDGRLSLGEARQYMLELINKDRTQNNLNPVALDEVAGNAAQKHAEEMAQNVYLSHLNLAGEKPDVRYTQAGGVDSVGENTYFWWSSNTGQAPVSLPLQTPAQTFARSDIEAIEGTYMAEKPPLDGHRVQILNPYHTHVGIGLGRATDGKSVCLANTQEFVERYLTLDAISQTAAAGEKIKISGTAPLAKPIYAIAIGVEALPTPKTREEVSRVTSYSRPEATEWLFAGRDFKVGKDGKFERTLIIPRDTRGVVYVMIWLRDDPKKTGLEGLFITSCRTVLVK
jgi:uncharacterized protein YkwD